MPGLRSLFVVSIAASMLMVGVGMMVPLLPQRVLDFSQSLKSVGYVASAFALSYLLVQIPLGTLADRLGAKPFLVLGYGLCGVSGIVFYHAGSAEAVYLGRFIQGAGEAPIWALGPALLSLAYPQAKGKVIGIYNASIHTGLTIGPLLGVLLFPTGGGLPFLLFAALCFSGALTVLLLLPAPIASRSGAGQASRPGELVKLITLPGPLVTLSGVLFYGAGYGIFISVLPASLALTKGFDNLAIGVFFALFYVAVSVAQLVVGPLSDKHGRHAYMIAGLIMAALGFATFGPFPHPWTYAPLTLASLGLGIFCVSSLTYLNDCAPAPLKATVSGSYYLAWGLGYFLGPLAVGQLGEMLSPQASYILFALLLAGQAVGVFASRKRKPDAGLDSA